MPPIHFAIIRVVAALACAASVAGLGGAGVAPAAASDGQVGSGSPASCSPAALAQTLGAVQASGGWLITFDCGAAPHTIVVATQLLITSTVAFDGGSLLTLSGGNSARVFRVQGGHLTLNNLVVSHGNGLSANGGCIFNVGGVLVLNNSRVERCYTGHGVSGGGIDSQGGSVTLNHSVVAHNSASQHGGGIRTTSSAHLSVNNSHIYSNTAHHFGGGIFAAGILTITGSLLEYNRVDFGGGLFAEEGATAAITGSRFYSNTANNTGGGIHSGGQLTMTLTTMEANYAAGDGAGLSIRGDDATAHVDQVIIRLNHANAGGGVYFDEALEFAAFRSSFAANSAQDTGGGLYLTGGSVLLHQVVIRDNAAGTGNGGGLRHVTGALFLSTATVSGNTADGSLSTGGGLHSTGDALTLENVTFSGNSAGQFGGGIYRNDATLMDLINVTLANNSAGLGGGYYQATGSNYALRNTLLANNTGGNCYGPNGTAASSLSTDNTCILGAGRSNVNAALGPLQVNGSVGGFQFATHMPGAGSAAIDNGTRACYALWAMSSKNLRARMMAKARK